MKLANSQPELACDKKDVRSQITEPYLDVDKKALISTNGWILASVSVIVENEDKSGHISAESLKAARKCAKCKPVDKVLEISANEKLELRNGQTFNRPHLGRFPEYQKVINDAKKPLTRHRVALDAKFLLDLAKAINLHGNTQVILNFPEDSEKPIFVESTNHGAGEGNFGVIMPCRID